METETSPVAAEGTDAAKEDADTAAAADTQEESTGDVAKDGEGGEDATEDASSTRSVAVKIQQVPEDEVNYKSHSAALSADVGVSVRGLIRVQYSTVQYSTVQYSTVQYSTVQYSSSCRLQGKQGSLASDGWRGCTLPASAAFGTNAYSS